MRPIQIANGNLTKTEYGDYLAVQFPDCYDGDNGNDDELLSSNQEGFFSALACASCLTTLPFDFQCCNDDVTLSIDGADLEPEDRSSTQNMTLATICTTSITISWLDGCSITDDNDNNDQDNDGQEDTTATTPSPTASPTAAPSIRGGSASTTESPVATTPQATEAPTDDISRGEVDGSTGSLSTSAAATSASASTVFYVALLGIAMALL